MFFPEKFPQNDPLDKLNSFFCNPAEIPHLKFRNVFAPSPKAMRKPYLIYHKCPQNVPLDTRKAILMTVPNLFCQEPERFFGQ